ncbi:MAG TPA: hypothetical protein VE136_13205 [Anaerolineales bacterium]|nr:hypothetical protein [Anaerolineales bacterium]
MLKKAILWKTTLGLLLAGIMTACAQTSKSISTPTSLSATPPPKLKTSVTPTMDAGLLAQAKEDLASRLSLDLDQISLVEAKSVFWRDASLGCPQPGTVYAQVITPGYLITLEANGKKYEYHAATSQYVFLCDTKGTPIEPVPLMLVAPHGKPSKCVRTPCPKIEKINHSAS